ncbi:hypothetical protein [Variovorax sp. DT-64]|uniref:hypothetical protein n=1 Tax=Variovorax sp. DT-64 TaxID=3396160 RepID=UPI003F1C3C9A
MGRLAKAISIGSASPEIVTTHPAPAKSGSPENGSSLHASRAHGEQDPRVVDLEAFRGKTKEMVWIVHLYGPLAALERRRGFRQPGTDKSVDRF